VRHAAIVRRIVDFFEAKFGPETRGRIAAKPSEARRKKLRKLREELFARIDEVQSFTEDRVLRTFANLVDATLRTNFYVADRPYPSIAHKIDCAMVTSMRDPRPWREIYVQHPELEGVHLRGGKIARGGLRWSDRIEDFRTEILGLMTTQMVKNVVIVPVGAKGGFVLKRPPADPASLRAHADAIYQVFIHALLDLTDNVVGNKTTPPREVVCYDDPDPYLVVAADKGTAHLSDTANAISESRGFWMGDAFASGGSNGYDHKAVGITARGAWVCIRHLLAELGIDSTRQTFTAIGIGDMGGDVFGNGMLEHDTIGLVAAFNHLHVFLDPDPDPAASFRERRRLFRAKQGGWDQYDPARISKGGGVYERAAKSIPLSAQVRKLLGSDRTAMSGNELVHEILKLDVDLWYNGGIGTYVKASTEDHAAARDPSNDGVRVDADEIRARVVGEGGNLGFTQPARIEFARGGGRINTDFIDNAGGVNISDHEVNLKILLQPLVASGRLSLRSRNRLLKDMEPFITADVLAANGDQALLLSLDERRSRENLAPFDGVMDEVCRRFAVKRSDLVLPSVRQIGARMESGEGLTRPELAILSSYVKMMLYDDLVEDAEVDLAGILPSLRNYFPERVRRRFGKAIDAHRLGREIALTRLTNRIIDYTGIAFFHEMAEACDASARQTFEAYSLLSRAADAWNLKLEIEALGNSIPTEARYRLMLTVESALRAGSQYLLETWSTARIREHLRKTGPYQRKLRKLADAFERVLDPISLGRAHELVEYFQSHGVPARIARRAAMYPVLPVGLTIQDLADTERRPPAALARHYFSLGQASSLLPTLRRMEELKPTEFYDALALKTLKRTLEELLRTLVLKLLPVKGDAQAKLDSLGSGRQAFQALAALDEDDLGPASLMVVADRIRSVLR
jgi:glutamate dehydrogenase